MRLNIKKYIESLLGWYNGLSSREKLLIWAGVLALTPIFISELVVSPVKQVFVTQSQQLESLKSDLKTVPHILDRYRKVSKKKQDIEKEFQQVEIKEGEQTLLETILSGKVDAGFDINPGVIRAFGGNYEQASFSVRFTITSLNGLIDLLTEISTGAKRMLLTSLSVSKDPSGDRLRVEISVSSIRKIK
jgi:hypothetical protein